MKHIHLNKGNEALDNTTSIASPTQTYNMLQHTKTDIHYLPQHPLHNKQTPTQSLQQT